jgi:cysteine-rich repeat protein
MKLARTALTVVVVAAVVGPALAVQAPPSHTAGPALEVAEGNPVRTLRSVGYTVPPHALRNMAAFVAEAGPRWRSMWDTATGVPTRMWGEGIEVPGSMAKADLAEAFSIGFLQRHVDLLAPGASASEFKVVSNVVHAGIRSVGLHQYRDGIRVLGGQLSFRFKNDRMFMLATEALPHVSAIAPRGQLEIDALRDVARRWILTDAAATADRGVVDGPYILPLVGPTRVLDYRTVVRVTVASDQPIGKWEVFVDADTGVPVARRQTLMFATGTVLFDTPVRRPTDVRMDYPATRGDFTVDGESLASSEAGVLDWAGAATANVTLRARGDWVRVDNDSGAAITADFTLDPDGTLTWSEPDDELLDSQLSCFIHTNIVKAYAKGITPNMTWLDEQIRCTVNIANNCNAFSDGTNINFFTRGGGCENTGRLADVVYLEFGHSYHAHSIIEGVGDFDGALSEGISDYLAATITNDSGMGRGFFMSNAPLREINPSVDLVYPDDLRGEVHADGEIIAGTLWDLRTNLIATLGEAEGVAQADFLFQAGIARATDMVTMYPEILAADDDDGDLDNGTPNECDINEAFGRHGLLGITASIGDLSAEVPEQDGFHVTIGFQGISPRCGGGGVGGAQVIWNLRGNTAVTGNVPMTPDSEGTTFEGVIPPQPEGSVVQFQIVVDLGGDKNTIYPENPADQLYEFFVGTVEEIYCTDFEADPSADGWTHGLTAGEPSEGADDWQWDTPAGRTGSGDPAKAFSGERVFGNDLGHDNFNGLYQSDKVNYALSPAVDIGEFTDVRLQYRRWLTVEDGTFDQGSIYANDTLAWSNQASTSGMTQHTDREWRFHDVPLSEHVVDGVVQIKYEIASDGGLNMGGWTLDDFCIVGYVASVCGDGEQTGIEQCDDGAANGDDPDACRADCTPAACGDGIVDTGEACDDGNDIDDDECTASCTRPPGFEEDSGDCGCVVGGRNQTPLGGLALLLFGAALALRVRRRKL